MAGAESRLKTQFMKYGYQACQIPSEPGGCVQRAHFSVFVSSGCYETNAQDWIGKAPLSCL